MRPQTPAGRLLGHSRVGLLVAVSIALLALALAAADSTQTQGASASAPEERVLTVSTPLSGPAGERSGVEVFADACAVCHGSQGQGRIAPGLAGNTNLERSDYLVALILRGGDGMPAFHQRLSEGEVVAVAEYTRSAWGNDFGAVTSGQLVSQWWRGAADSDELYQRVCARCHGTSGGGGVGPALAQNQNLAEAQYLVGKVLNGQGGMPAFAGLLSNERVSELATHVRMSFGNDFGPIEDGLVNQLRSRDDQPFGALSATVSPSGSLSATVTPSGSLLTLIGPDRQVRTSTEAGGGRFAGLVPGRYTVSASSAGYLAASQTVEVRPERDSRVTLKLEPLTEPHEAPSEGPRRVSVESEESAEARSAESAGTAIYRRHCSACHGSQGGGGVAPAFRGNEVLRDLPFTLSRIVMGGGGMPPFGEILLSDEIADVAALIRTSWANEFGTVGTAQARNYGAGGQR